MPVYGNLSGNSGVIGYRAGKDSIVITFRDGGRYVYSEASAGKHHIDEMKRLAALGRGLASYINRHVRERYESRGHP